MAEEKQIRRLFNHHKEEHKPVEAVVYSETAYGVDGSGQRYETSDTVGFGAMQPGLAKELTSRQRNERLGELGPLAAGAFSLFDKHQGKKDQMQEHRHKMEEEIATAVAVGAGGYTFHEHHQKKALANNM